MESIALGWKHWLAPTKLGKGGGGEQLRPSVRPGQEFLCRLFAALTDNPGTGHVSDTRALGNLAPWAGTPRRGQACCGQVRERQKDADCSPVFTPESRDAIPEGCAHG